MAQPLSESELAQRRQGHWRDNRRLTAKLLLVWAVTTVGVVYWPASWDFVWGGWPFGFWLAAQGVLLLYLALVWWYDWRMLGVDRRWGASDDLTEQERGDAL